ncbi:hypothetical protein M404DRAFT_1002823 [Pisolithus tinctorius Marx 270]|uniref:Uncharacterized protein n=1 Tax=Pisolithus tinctorius Marx 270 TaxID=870435 RepID=A0A0C3P2G7_PISTI|nr:hypothetical protein M404DRAFT_1002823 [Pisolithus tinctorius Marx 270]
MLSKVEQIWKRPRTTTTILYLIVRVRYVQGGVCSSQHAAQQLRYFGTLCGVFNATVFLSDVSEELYVIFRGLNPSH